MRKNRRKDSIMATINNIKNEDRYDDLLKSYHVVKKWAQERGITMSKAVEIVFGYFVENEIEEKDDEVSKGV